MTKVTEFPPVTYSSSFVSYLIQAANDNDICESSIDSVCKNNPSSKISPLVKMRWKQLARNAFNHSVDQKVKQQAPNSSSKGSATGNSANNGNSAKALAGHHPSVNGFLNKSSLIDLITLNAPAPDDLLICDRIDNWVQLSGHEDSFALAGPGTIWKKRSSDSAEVEVYEHLTHEPIAEMIPKFYRNVEYKGESFIEMEDLLFHYKDASIMDIKMGSRTFLESEVTNSKARHDLYDKMVKIDPHEPTEEEHMAKAITKLRYMQFREKLSSSSNLGLRIEGFKVGSDLKHNKNLHLIKRREDVKNTLASFFFNKPEACQAVVHRLRKLRKFFENSVFFQTHEVIGSSLLLIYTSQHVEVRMIDFAKTVPLPPGVSITHRAPWKPGSYEDGFLTGLDNLISILSEVRLD